MVSRRVKKVLIRLALVTCASLFALVLAEVFYRVLFAGDNGPTTNPLYVEHDDLRGWRYRAYADLRHATDEFDVAIRTDADGWRTGATSATQRSGPTVVCLGDSFTFGWGVEEEETFVALLRSSLGANIRNLGVSGYGPGQQLITLRQAGFEPLPDLVIVVFCINDLTEVLTDFMYGKSKPQYVLDGDELQIANSPVRWNFVERHCQVFGAVRRQLVEWGRSALSPDELERARRLTKRLHREIAAEVQKHGGRLLVVAEGVD